MTSARRLHHTYREYLDALAVSELRLEYFDGEIFAMAGGTPERGLLTAGLIALLARLLPARCRVLSSDVKIRVESTGLATFPDLSVVCGPIERAPDDANAVVNPILLVEVLSPSTEEYDRGEKLRHYQAIPSLQTVLLVAHDAPRVTVVSRGDRRWHTREFGDGDLVGVDVPPLTFAVRDVYAALAPVD